MATKMMNGALTLNTKNFAIEMDKKFAAAAANVFSAEYEKLQEVRRAYPNYKVVTVARKEKTSGTSGLTFEFMELYIEQHDDEEKSIMAEFKMMRAEDDASKAVGAKSESFLTIREWFLDKYPEVREFHEKRGKIVEDLRKKKEEAKKTKLEAERKERREKMLKLIA